MESNEIRVDIGLGAHTDGVGLKQAGQKAAATAQAKSASDVQALMEGIQQGLAL
jgi:hypothetical protein